VTQVLKHLTYPAMKPEFKPQDCNKKKKLFTKKGWWTGSRYRP
jgi:hypothetical protein